MTTALIAPPWWVSAERLMSAADPSFSHRPAQAAAAEMVDAAMRTRTHAALDLPTGSGKGLALDTPILTEHGWSTMGALSVGDRIHAIDGTLTEVLMASEIKFLDCYRVTFADGATFVCDAEHLWHVFDQNHHVPGSGKYGKKGAWRVLDIEHIHETHELPQQGKANRRWRYGVSVDRVLERPTATLPIDPYLLGWWLGNGHSHAGVITTHPADAEHLTEHIVTLGLPFTVRPNVSGATIIKIANPDLHNPRAKAPLLTDLRALGLYRNKHIPEMYLLADAEQRAALLAGLVDSDGHTSLGHSGAFTSTTENLAHGVVFLLRSLGYKASIREKRAQLRGKDYGPFWLVSYSVSVDQHPYRSPRRIAQVRSTGSKKVSTNKIRSVERISSVPTRCIRVAHESHVFLAGESLTPTHNSLLALAAAENAKGRTVISTATRALQSQLREKDIPALQAAGVLTREIVVLEGRGRYACLNRAVHELDRVQPAGKKIVRAVIKHLRKHPDVARRDDIPVAIPDWLWTRICSDPDACKALNCRTGGSCAYIGQREAARTADIVVASHSLLLADAMLKGGSAVNWGLKSSPDGENPKPAVLGPYRNLIVDEAHALENAAESFGEQRVTVRGIQALMTRVSKHEGSGAATRALATCLQELQGGMLGQPKGALLAPTGSVFAASYLAADAAGQALRGAGSSFEGDISGNILVAACYGLRDRIKAIDTAMATGSDEFGARAVSVEGAPGHIDATGIKSQLVDAGPWLVEHLFKRVPTIAMSGTLAVPGRRDWAIERIGLDAKVQVLPTSFNLREQRLVYVTPRVEAKGAAFAARSTEADVLEIEKLIEASSGRALVLFPANQDLKFVERSLKISHTLLAQGVTTDGRSTKGDPIYATNATLAKRFTDDTSSVLLATRSFFEGVDFPGEQCSLVIIVRFPNLRPDDPLTLARRRAIEGRGGNAWVEYQEPAMQIIFRQAAGRAIRRVTDKGVVAVIDPRSGSKAYAKTALRSLAPSDYTDRLEHVAEFLR